MLNSLLITGSSGFIGTNLYEQFHADFLLYGLDITTKGKFPEENVFAWDNPLKLPPVNTIIHLAGKAHDLKNASNPQSYFDINVGLTQRIFDHFLASDAQKFIFFSSVKAVADRVEGPFLAETAAAKPLTPYGQSKLQAEQYILSKPLPPGKKVYILRPSMIHGPGNKGNLNLLYKVVSTGLPWPLGAFHNERSFTSIDNLLFILRQLIEKEIEPGIYQVSDDESVSTNEIIQLLAQSLGKKPGIWNVNPAMVNWLAKTGDLLHLPLNSERLKKLTESYVVSNAKLKAALGVGNLPVGAKEGLLRTFASFRDCK